MRIENDLLYISEMELIALLVKLRDPGSGAGFDGAFDPDYEDGRIANPEPRLRAESDLAAMENTPKGVNPMPIVSALHTGGMSIVRQALSEREELIKKNIAQPVF
jgi:hypothetical protein